MIYACDNCRFLFSRAAEPEQCPDCGKYAVRPATREERLEYEARLGAPQSAVDGERPDGHGGPPPAGAAWDAILPLLPDFTGQSVLDLGCGDGRYCRCAASRGAERVLGVDLIRRPQTAGEKDSRITYRCAAIEDLQLPEGSFDTVLSFLTLHYIQDLTALTERVYRWLRPGGRFLFTVEHPMLTAWGAQDPRRASGERLFPMDGYYAQGLRETVVLGERVTKVHRTVSAYLEAVLRSGFTLRHVMEPLPEKAPFPDRDGDPPALTLVVAAARE